MSESINLVHLVAGLIVLAEALNKLERTCLRCPRASAREWFLDVLKAVSWVFLALGAGGAVAVPLFNALGIHGVTYVMHETPSLAETFVLTGFAVLAIRTRLKDETDQPSATQEVST